MSHSVTVSVPRDVSVAYLLVCANVRYWEDATVNAEEDTDGSRIPCREGDAWCPVIRLADGVIVNWRQGTAADVHYKVCDAGRYYLLDEKQSAVLELEDGHYVPTLLSPSDPDSDYIILHIDDDGKIDGWRCTDLLLSKLDWKPVKSAKP